MLAQRPSWHHCPVQHYMKACYWNLSPFWSSHRIQKARRHHKLSKRYSRLFVWNAVTQGRRSDELHLPRPTNLKILWARPKNTWMHYPVVKWSSKSKTTSLICWKSCGTTKGTHRRIASKYLLAKWLWIVRQQLSQFSTRNLSSSRGSVAEEMRIEIDSTASTPMAE